VALPGVRPSLSQSSRGRRAFSLPHMFGADVRQLTVDQVDPTRPKGPASRRACRPNGIGNDCSAPLHAPCDVAPSLGRLPYCRSHRKGRHRSVRCPARTGSTTATEADPMTGPLGSFPRALASTTRPCRVPGHPEAIPEHLRNIPRRIDDPATAARVALDLLRSRHEDLTLALYLDDRHRAPRWPCRRRHWLGAGSSPVGPPDPPRVAGQPGPPAASSSGTAATEPVAPRKPRIASSVPSLQRAAGTGSPWSITWWWSRLAASRRHSGAELRRASGVACFSYHRVMLFTSAFARSSARLVAEKPACGRSNGHSTAG
jgi:hypothetical protein